jgi:hypothetical protein
LGLFRRAPGIGFVPSCAWNWVCSVVRRGRTQESATSWVRFAEAKGVVWPPDYKEIFECQRPLETPAASAAPLD